MRTSSKGFLPNTRSQVHGIGNMFTDNDKYVVAQLAIRFKRKRKRKKKFDVRLVVALLSCGQAK